MKQNQLNLEQQEQQKHQQRHHPYEAPNSLDPMRPPTVRLTQQSAEGDGRYLKARLRDPKIMNAVRVYLAYLHDKDSSICVGGTTSISARIFFASEGLPTATTDLKKIFLDVHEELGINAELALADLKSFGKYLHNERIQHLQRTNESTKKFYCPNFRA